MRHCLLLFGFVLCLSLPVLADSATDKVAGDKRSEAFRVELGQEISRGVTAKAVLLSQVDGMPGTRLLRVDFYRPADHAMVVDGDVAVKVVIADRTQPPIRLLPHENSFQAQVPFAEDSEIQYWIGCKLDDGKKRRYRFYTLPPRPVVEQVSPSVGLESGLF